MMEAVYRLRIGDGLMCDKCHCLQDAGDIVHLELSQYHDRLEVYVAKVYCAECHEKERGKQ